MTGTTMLIQALLLLAVLALALYFLSNRRKARAKAGVKIGFVLFIVLSVWAVLRPDDLTVVAQWLGVSRGTDLLLYMLVVGFVFTTMSTYMRLREQELRYARLARAIALQNAVKPDNAVLPESELPPDSADAELRQGGAPSSATMEDSHLPRDNR